MASTDGSSTRFLRGSWDTWAAKLLWKIVSLGSFLGDDRRQWGRHTECRDSFGWKSQNLQGFSDKPSGKTDELVCIFEASGCADQHMWGHVIVMIQARVTNLTVCQGGSGHRSKESDNFRNLVALHSNPGFLAYSPWDLGESYLTSVQLNGGNFTYFKSTKCLIHS